MAGQLVAQSGGWMQRIAQAWLVLEVSESPLALGTIVTVQFLPILLLSLFGGFLADRFPKRSALMVTQGVSAAQAVGLWIVVATGTVELWHIYVLALVLGVANAIEQPIRQAFPAELVGRDLIPHAVALNSAVHNTARIVGPAAGGVVVAWLGTAGAFAVNAAGHIAVIVSLVLMRISPAEGGRMMGRGHPIAQIVESLRYAAGSSAIVSTLVTLGSLSIFAMNYSTFTPLLARNELGMGPEGYGMLSAALGAGAIVGAVAAAAAGRPTRLGQASVGVAVAVILGGVALSPWVGLTLALMAGMGALTTVFTTSANTALQLRVADDMRGRIMGLYTLIMAGMTPPGAMITGTLADAWGIRVALGIEALICGVGILAGVGYGAWAARRAR